MLTLTTSSPLPDAPSTPTTPRPGRGAGRAERRSVARQPRRPLRRRCPPLLHEFHAAYDGFYGAFAHDPLATAAALDETLVRTRALAVDVDASGGVADGQTIADWRGLWHRTPNVDVAVEANVDEFLRRWVERVGTLAATRLDVAR
jgi:inosine-uridine nucleoside N-ribohydrolase